MLSPSIFAVLLSAAMINHGQAVAHDQVRWASSGGGWRAMSANIAYANVFRQAGLISDTSSSIKAISTESGASWFSSQFFYSQPFFDNVTESSPTELSDFVLAWMNSYQDFTATLTQNPDCDFLENITDIPPFMELADFCNIFVDFDGDWASFVSGMMSRAASDYGDSNLVNKTVSVADRIPAMKETGLFLQTSLTPNSRIRSSNVANYIGPGSGADAESGKVYSIPICFQWTVAKNSTLFYSTVPEESLPLVTYEKSISDRFEFREWDDNPFFPGNGASILMDRPRESKLSGNFSDPFGGLDPTVGQIASASSAAIGPLSPLVPSTLAQYASVYRYEIQNSNLSVVEEGLALEALTDAMNILYSMSIFDDISVCDEWPADCNLSNGRFIDGAFTDSPTLALNIGQYQTRENGDLTKTLKIILTNDNNAGFGPETVLAYFNTTFNANVEPGGFLWPVNYTNLFNLPVASPQIFGDFLDLETLDNITESIDGINVTTAVIKTTTIENPVFKTKAGQPVDILLLRLNSDIPTTIIGTPEIEKYKVPLADMVNGIAASETLVERVRNFVDSGLSNSPTPSPSTQNPSSPVPSSPVPVTPGPTSQTSTGFGIQGVASLSAIMIALVSGFI